MAASVSAVSPVLALCNVMGSQATREADYVLYTRADLQAGTRIQDVVSLAGGLAAHHVAEREDGRAGLPGEPPAGDVAELRAVGAERDDVAVLEYYHGARVRNEGRDRRGKEHLAVADADHERALVACADDDVGLVG